MEHLLEELLHNYNANLKGFVFGFAHVGIMLIGYYSGWSINRFLKFASNGYVAGIIGAGLSHVIADLLASLIDPHLREMVLGIVIGGIVPLLIIPLLEKYIVKNEKHIVRVDHEDIWKHLGSH